MKPSVRILEIQNQLLLDYMNKEDSDWPFMLDEEKDGKISDARAIAIIQYLDEQAKESEGEK